MKASETQVSGNHYKDYAIQPAEFIQKNGLNWCEGNAVKYLVRHRHKNGAEDVKKALHYLQLLLEWEYGETEEDEDDCHMELLPVFQQIIDEYHRSLAEHTPWEEAGHSAWTMASVLHAEMAEVDLAINMGDYEEAVKELVHVANVACKAIVELTRRGKL